MRKTESKVRRDPKGRILRSGEYYDEVKQRYKYRYRDAKGTYHDTGRSRQGFSIGDCQSSDVRKGICHLGRRTQRIRFWFPVLHEQRKADDGDGCGSLLHESQGSVHK